MYKNKSFLAILPARAGSKRLPNKNIMKIKGKPLMQWSIDSAIKSRYIDQVCVSSDCPDILKLAKENDVMSVERPSNISNDTSLITDAISHVVDVIMVKYDYIVLLQPTSPLRTSSHVDQAIEFLLAKHADAVVSVCELDHPHQWVNKLPKNLSFEGFLDRDVKNKRGQDLEKYYRINGALYICASDRFREENTLVIKDNIYSFVMDRRSSVDIDEDIDFKLAECLLEDGEY